MELLSARLFDQEDFEVGDADLIAAPVPQVLFVPAEGEETLDVTADVTWKDSFTYTPHGDWRLSLNRHRMLTPGTYLVTMESGDESEYLIDPTCSKSVVKKVYQHKKAKKHKKEKKDKEEKKHHQRRH